MRPQQPSDGLGARQHPTVGTWATVAAAVDHNRSIAARDESGDLVSPIAAVAQTAMQQDHRWANAVSAIPDAGSVIFDIAQIARDRKWRGAARFESS
jgi:hypothetical protein